MSKFYGKIGFAVTTETEPGIWEESITEHFYYGDVIQSSIRSQSSQNSVNDNITITNKFSIISDLFANNNCYAMRYVEYMGAKWKITNIDVQYPRLILTVGGLFNGQQT